MHDISNFDEAATRPLHYDQPVKVSTNKHTALRILLEKKKDWLLTQRDNPYVATAQRDLYAKQVTQINDDIRTIQYGATEQQQVALRNKWSL